MLQKFSLLALIAAMGASEKVYLNETFPVDFSSSAVYDRWVFPSHDFFEDTTKRFRISTGNQHFEDSYQGLYADVADSKYAASTFLPEALDP